VKPAQPLNPTPFVTLLTPTFRRPTGLAACLQSVGRQTAAADVQQVVMPDHVGHGVADGLFGRLAWYAPSVIGAYVNILCDDDVLADESVVARVQAFAAARRQPPVIVTRVVKGGLALPQCAPEGPPVHGLMALTSFIVRADIWRAHLGDSGRRYVGDFDHASALYRAGHPFAFCDVHWAVGGASNGRPEAEA
jgi:hypothetical protein